MDGGALLGQGTFGCVFTPPLLCNKKTYLPKKGEVGKITEPIDVVSEIKAADTLSKIKGNYFVLPNPSSVCHVDMKGQTDTDLKGCNFIKEVDTQDIIHFTMPYGGVSIRKMFTGASLTPIPIIPFVKHILEGGTQLALHGYVHYDIHQENVLVQPKTLEPRFIDFGMSFSANSITQKVLDDRWKVYSPDYSPEPPEVTCITALRKGKVLNTVIQDIIKKKGVLRDAETMLGLSRQVQLKRYMKFWTSSKAIRDSDWVKFFQLYWTSFDAWGIGVVILNLIRMSDYKDLTILKPVLKGLLCMDPRGRLDCVEALLMIDPENTVINSAAGKAWRKERDIIRDAIKS